MCSHHPNPTISYGPGQQVEVVIVVLFGVFFWGQYFWEVTHFVVSKFSGSNFLGCQNCKGSKYWEVKFLGGFMFWISNFWGFKKMGRGVIFLRDFPADFRTDFWTYFPTDFRTDFWTDFWIVSPKNIRPFFKNIFQKIHSKYFQKKLFLRRRNKCWC